MAVVLNQAQFSKLVHEVTYTRPCGADQLSKRLLANFCDNRLGSTFLAKIRQQKKRSCQSLFGRIEQLIDQVLFNSNSARQEVRDEHLRKGWLVMEDADQADFSSRMISHSVIALAVAKRRGCPVRHPPPQNSSGLKIETTASFPCSETTVI